MILTSLCDYYEVMVRKGLASPEGYTPNIRRNYLVCLNRDGTIDEILYQGRPKAENPKQIEFPMDTFPARSQKSGIEANIVEHRPLYLFGLNCDKGEFSPNDRTDKAKKSHAAFVEASEAFFEGMTSPLSVAFLGFVRRWKCEEETQNPHLMAIAKDYDKSTYSFCLTGRPTKLLQYEPEVKQKWDRVYAERKSDKDEILSVCPVYGELLPTAGLHDKIKGIKGGQASGCVLICFNNPSENSYGKEQSYNSGVSEKAMKKYTEALNYLLREPKHHSYLGNMTLVWFAIDKKDGKDEEKCNDFFRYFVMGNVEEKTAENVEGNLKGTVDAIAQGKKSDFSYYDDVDENISFYLFGLVPNSSRVAVKFAYCNTFGSLRNNLKKYHEEFAVGNSNAAPALWRIEKELVSPKAKNEEVPPDFTERMLQSILNGNAFPYQIMNTVIRRIKTDSDEENKHYIKMNDTRIGLLKACLNRNYKEDVKMSLDLQNKNPAYLCGRLFAVLEKIQQDASGSSLNRTIKDAYFASAAATPAIVFARLMKLSGNHLSKLSDGSQVFYNKLIGGIIDELSAFPKTLSQEAQGLFIIGYYHQNKELYTKKEKTEEM